MKSGLYLAAKNAHVPRFQFIFVYERQVQWLCNAPHLDSLFKWLHVAKMFSVDTFCMDWAHLCTEKVLATGIQQSMFSYTKVERENLTMSISSIVIQQGTANVFITSKNLLFFYSQFCKNRFAKFLFCIFFLLKPNMNWGDTLFYHKWGDFCDL